MRTPRFVTLRIASLLFLFPAALLGQDTRPNLYLKVELDKQLKLSALRPGDLVEGKASRTVYWRDKELFPAGSRVRLTVDKLEKRRRVPNDHWPWVVKAFTPRYEKYPVFRLAQVSLPNGAVFPVKVSLASLCRDVEVRAPVRKDGRLRAAESDAANQESAPKFATTHDKSAALRAEKSQNFTATFDAELVNPQASLPSDHLTTATPSALNGEALNIPAGTHARVVLLDSVSAAKSRPGDSFHARLIDPIYFGTAVALPEGVIFDGKVTRRTPPRMLSRAGSLLISFTSMTTSAGTAPIAASLAGIELDQRSHTRVDPEGQLSGDHPGKAWLAINLATTAGIAKATDDGLQLVIEAIVSTATDVSTAGTARIAAACVSGVFLLTRHGRDVVLPTFTEMDVVFNRSAQIPIATAGGSQPSKVQEPNPDVDCIKICARQ